MLLLLKFLLEGALLFQFIYSSEASSAQCWGHHKVNKRETCQSIAKRYDIPISDLVTFNRNLFSSKNITCDSKAYLPHQLRICHSGFYLASFPELSSAPTHRPVRPNYASLSIEMSVAHTYIGDPNAPNKFTMGILKNLKDRCGETPMIRLGGSSADRMLFNTTNCGHNYVQPALIQTMASISDKLDTRWVLGLNLGSNDLQNTMSEAVYAVKVLRKNLFALEIGNEPNAYVRRGYRSRHWNIKSYLNEYDQWSTAILNALKGQNQNSLIEVVPSHLSDKRHHHGGHHGHHPHSCDAAIRANSLRAVKPLVLGVDFSYDIFQAGAICCSWDSMELIGAGLFHQAKPQTISLSYHFYFGGCKFEPISFLLNHTYVRNAMKLQFAEAVKATEAAGKEFVVGETSSFACGGEEGVSNAFGAALFTLDYMLLGASMGISRLHFHNGGSTKYNVVWYGHLGSSSHFSPNTAQPTYYSFLVFAEVIGKNETTVQEVDMKIDSIAAYALWEGGKMARMLFINHNIKGGKHHNPVSHMIKLKAPQGVTRATFKVLEAKSTYEQHDIHWAGQTMHGSPDGSLQGKVHKSTGKVKNGILDVIAKTSSAVLVTFH